jgi:hypothetical protein
MQDRKEGIMRSKRVKGDLERGLPLFPLENQVPHIDYKNITFGGRNVTTTTEAAKILSHLLATHQENRGSYVSRTTLESVTNQKNVNRCIRTLREALDSLGIVHWLQYDRYAGYRWYPHALPQAKK